MISIGGAVAGSNISYPDFCWMGNEGVALPPLKKNTL